MPVANCVTCSAPLPAKAVICEYCGSKHDIDFHAIKRFTVSRSQTERICPHCDIVLRSINLRADNKFQIDRCEQCQGVFFDHNELAALLENSVTNVFEIDRHRLESICKESYQGRSEVKYVKCPDCRNFMQRSNYGSMSGVIVDKCRDHGVWLDSGELNQLMLWKKAGGELLHDKRVSSHEFKTSHSYDNSTDMIIDQYNGKEKIELPDLGQEILSSVSSLVKKFFK